MPPTTDYNRGDIVLVRFPFTDLSSAKKRPALVISPDSFNRFNQDLILVALTSHLSEEDNTVLVEDGDFLRGGLPKRSVVKLTKIFTIHSSQILKQIGTLKPAKMEEILERLRRIFS